MRAIQFNKNNSTFELKVSTTDKPKISDNEILVKVHATSLNTGDVARIKMGLVKANKTITGSEFAGTIVEVGNQVSQFKIGDNVFGYKNTGTHAEFVKIGESETVIQMPNDITFESAATIPNGASAALHFLEKGGILSKDKVLINGGSGSVGTFAIQIAKYYGKHVTVTCSQKNFELVKSLGADEIIDYKKYDFTDMEDRYDLIFDAVGKVGFNKAKLALKKGGSFVSTGLSPTLISQMLYSSLFSNKKAFVGIAKQSKSSLSFLKELCEEGFLSSVIDKKYKLSELTEAYNYVDSGRKRGNVCITV